ncbi:MAG: flavodoxin family protein [Candidatus Eremiobacteraeota bacterium]|nr:flavodoxin family protein [Candidatus Eremiobacteraeota bacterium]
MKVTAFNGSPRKDGNTDFIIRYVFKELEKEGIETEMVQLAGKKIRGCISCYKCMKNKDRRCAIDNDIINKCIKKILESDGIILGSPSYFSNVTAEMKALIDRAGLVAKVNGDIFKRKVGVAVASAGREGGVNVCDSINRFFLTNEMIVPGSNASNFGIGLQKGEVQNDQEGLLTIKTLGENMAWLLKKVHW